MITHVADNTSMPPVILQALSLCSSFVKTISVNEEHVQFAYQHQRHLVQIQSSNLKEMVFESEILTVKCHQVSHVQKQACTRARATESPDVLTESPDVLTKTPKHSLSFETQSTELTLPPTRIPEMALCHSTS